MNLAMTTSEREAFLAGVHIGVLAIPDGDRGPLTAPIWYSYAPGGDLQVIISPDSRKGKRIANGTRISLVAQQEAMPYRYVSVEGETTSITPATHNDLETLAIRYLGEEQGRAYAQQNQSPNVVVNVRIDRWLTVDYGKMAG